MVPEAFRMDSTNVRCMFVILYLFHVIYVYRIMDILDALEHLESVVSFHCKFHVSHILFVSCM